MQMQKILAESTMDSSKIRTVDNPGLVFLGTARYHPYTALSVVEEQTSVRNQIKKLPQGDPNIQKLNDRLKVLAEAYKEARRREKISYFLDITPGGKELGGNFYGPKDSKIPPEQLVFNNPGEAPNFARAVTSWKQKTNLYGDIDVEVFNSNNGQFAYMICRDSGGRVWIGNVEQIQSPITSQGIRRDWIKGGDLTTPAYEYLEQTGRYGNVNNSKEGYVDMWENYLKHIPVIKAYENARRGGKKS